eukprot:TRINITY_DN28598_c0_g1_i1.p2 TRINITY_DN28598_c0_g1~~TRINITY_DN28598_c0_g1_i1.p2  ORF type:complete len:291 (+),score=84.89 TRINITY_DN28598_c0_g1_i1:63-875(+)
MAACRRRARTRPVALVFLTGHRVHAGDFDEHATVADVQRTAEDALHAPSGTVALAHEGRPLRDSELQLPAADGTLVLNCAVHLRGGKGGFGSNLRARGKAASQRTTNFDACRDLNGNRIRHVRQEKSLQKWLQGEKDADFTTTKEVVGVSMTARDMRIMRQQRDEGLRRDRDGDREKSAFQKQAEERERRVQEGWEVEKEKIRGVAAAARDAVQAGQKRGIAEASDPSDSDAMPAARAPPAKRPRGGVFDKSLVSDTSGDDGGCIPAAPR